MAAMKPPRFPQPTKLTPVLVAQGILPVPGHASSGIVARVHFGTTASRLFRSLNLPDGRVEAYAIGTPDQLAKLRSILERGPWGATVSEVREEQAAIDSNYDDGFVINY